MVNYQNGKIYKIESLEGKCMYIGSTCQKLCVRMAGHRASMKKNRGTTSKEVLKYTDAKIYLIENYPCDSKEELLRKEGEYIRKLDCVNTTVAGRTDKEYYNDTKDNKRAQWLADNKDKIQKYLNDNKDKIREQNKRRYAEKRKIKINCICGSYIQKYDIVKHNKTKKHIKFITKQ